MKFYILDNGYESVFSLSIEQAEVVTEGQIVYQSSIPFSQLQVDEKTEVAFQSWIPELAGDYEVGLSSSATDIDVVMVSFISYQRLRLMVGRISYYTGFIRLQPMALNHSITPVHSLNLKASQSLLTVRIIC